MYIEIRYKSSVFEISGDKLIHSDSGGFVRSIKDCHINIIDNYIRILTSTVEDIEVTPNIELIFTE